VTVVDAGARFTSVPGPRRRRPPALIVACMAFLGLVLLCVVAGGMIAPHDPQAQDLLAGLQGASWEHPLGTDDSGRDIFSRVIVGARSGVIGPLLVALGAATVGTIVGLTAGYRGGMLDNVVMRTVDLVLSLPSLLVAIVLLGIVGGGYAGAVLVLILFMAPYDTRLIRGATLEQRSLPYVDAARTTGIGPVRIAVRHIWPNIVPLIVANAFLTFAYSLVTLSALSFLGFGVPPGAADWGRMLSEGLPFIEDSPLLALAPGAAIVLTATSMNLLGDWTYERLSDRGRAR
jgi:peptide/nickel transport system permease protein